jgi:spore germination cell wall hydrolase CwlJ-like protein
MVIRSIALAAAMYLATSVSAAHAQSKSDETCLALTAFTEARDQGEHGMALVVHTVLERAKTRKTTVCRIAYAPGQYNGVEYWPKGRNPAQVNPVAWATAVRATQMVLTNQVDFGPCKGAQYFFAPAVVRHVPAWARKLPYMCRYKGHMFYGIA